MQLQKQNLQDNIYGYSNARDGWYRGYRAYIEVNKQR